MQANIWIRKENKTRWEGIKDKSGWINSLLKTLDTDKPRSRTVLVDKGSKKVLKEVAVCPHGAAKGYCRFSKCSYFKP